MEKSRYATRSDLKRVDAHEIQPEEYDEAPELTDKQLANATVSLTGLRPRGRPKAETKKEAVSLRLDADVLAAFRGQGGGWQTRINEVLRTYAKKMGSFVEVGKAKKHPTAVVMKPSAAKKHFMRVSKSGKIVFVRKATATERAARPAASKKKSGTDRSKRA